MSNQRPVPPAEGQLWLSRPPYTFLTYVTKVSAARQRTLIEYRLLDDDGTVLTEVRERLDESWWRNFRPLVRRFG